MRRRFKAQFRASKSSQPIDIFDYVVPLSGISYDEALDWVNAAHWDNLSVAEFSRKDGDYQSFVVAAYMTERRIEAVLAEDARLQADKQRKIMEMQNNIR